MSDDGQTEDTPQLSDSDTSDDESDQEPIESLVAGRERRKTAGNRYDRETILEEAPQEEDPDEVALLFADNEDEEDEEFKSDDLDDDADMSSSDDDDQGPNAAADDLDGEKEILKQAKEERSKKRKADLALTSVAGLRKKLKTDPTQPTLPAAKPKPSKKKERVTWVHAQDSGRSSLRKQTIAHRAETIQRLKESEAQSKKLKALKEKRDRERAEDAPKELTQADRLAEAARVERQNAKSLNRWEAMEKKRQEEQAAKLAALKNRKLDGPVVSWWSAKAKWIGPRLNKIGTKDAGDVLEGGAITKKKPGRKTKAELERLAAEKNAESNTPGNVQTSTENTAPATQAGVSQPSTDPTSTENVPAAPVPPEAKLENSGLNQAGAATTPSAPSTVPEAEVTPNQESTTTQPAENKPPEPQKSPVEPISEPSTEVPTKSADSFLEGIQEYASMQEDADTPNKGMGDGQDLPNSPKTEEPKPDVPMTDASPDESKSTAQAVPTTSPDVISNVKPLSVLSDTKESPSATPTNPLPAQPASEAVVSSDLVLQDGQAEVRQPLAQEVTDKDVVKIETLEQQGMEPKIDESLPEPVVEYSTRNLVMLEKFDALSNQARQEYSLFYNQRKPGKAVKSLKHSQELCPITALPVRYRDPATGIGYATAAAYKKLQELKDYQFAWSSMLGCYVGRDGAVAARGVPEGFLQESMT
jgi:vacuolar protein sorting-associated protein 72